MVAKKALICRPVDQTKELKEGLEKINIEVHSLPMIELQRVDDLSIIYNAFEELDAIDWIIFTSTNSVKYFFQSADEYGLKLYFYPNLKFATVGEKTKLALEQLGYRTNFVPIKYTAEVLAENIDDVKGKNILIPRSKLASNDYVNAFEKRGANVLAVDLYENLFIEYDRSTLNEQLKMPFDYLIFTSGSTFQSFHQNLTKASASLKNEKIICIGPSTAKVVKSFGYEVGAIAEPHDVNGIISCIKNLENV